mgnify:CR=1 FL=1
MDKKYIYTANHLVAMSSIDKEETKEAMVRLSPDELIKIIIHFAGNQPIQLTTIAALFLGLGYAMNKYETKLNKEQLATFGINPVEIMGTPNEETDL